MRPFGCAVSSVVEHHLDTVGVRGSKPLPRTTEVDVLKLPEGLPGEGVDLRGESWGRAPKYGAYYRRARQQQFERITHLFR